MSSLSCPSSYNMGNKRRGQLAIISNTTFVKSTKFPDKFPDRTGTNEDASRIESTFRKLGFESITTEENLTTEKMKDVIKQVGESDHASDDCVAVVLLTHADGDNNLYGTDCKPIKIEDLLSYLKEQKTLDGKPKIIFIQGPCSEMVVHESKSPYQCDGGAGHMVKLPVEADFLIYQSMASVNDQLKSSTGAVFTQVLCDVIDKHVDGETDFESLLETVNNELSEVHKSNPTKYGKTQMPKIISRLTGRIFFTPKSPKPK